MTQAGSIELSASLEDYLETILQLVREKHVARAKDIGARMKVRRSSVTGALHALADRDLINYSPYDVITLTDKGSSVAQEVLRRHEILRDFFVRVLAVPDKEADDAACRMEHAVSESIVNRFVEFVEFVERCPRGGAKWIKGFGYNCSESMSTSNCEKCVESVLKDVKSGNTVRTKSSGATASLDALKPGDRGAIVRMSGAGPIRRRLMDMGATKGTLVEIERVAPLGDPIEVKIRGYHLTLRKEEARQVTIQLLRNR